jgi:hypothetical protein
MKVDDQHQKVQITLTFAEAEKLWVILVDSMDDTSFAKKLTDKLNEYLNT